MKKTLSLILLAVSLFFGNAEAQKKVAVVTFIVNKQIGVTEFGPATYAAEKSLSNDSSFNMTPLLVNFHTQFFDDYSKSFPFSLVPETTVFSNDNYKAYIPRGTGPDALIDPKKLLIVPNGYKIILDWTGHEDEKNILKMLNDVDGVMDVRVTFKLVKIGLGGMGVVKVVAKASIMLFNKNGDEVFSLDEDAKSKSMSPMAAGVPIMTTEKILPMCESAMQELIVELQKDMPKLIKKADAKL